MEGYDVVALEDVLHIIDIFVTATGSKHLIMLEDMRKMKENAIVCNMGGWEWEFDFHALVTDPTIKREEIKKGDVDRFTFQEGNSILVLS
jgi:adenosylhomocysteinase